MTRAVPIASAALVLMAAWLGGRALLLPPFSAHMTLHMAVVAVAAPLVAFGLAGTRHDPAIRWPRLFSVLPASLAELVLVWGWHTPALHLAARQSAPAFVLEQVSFFASGVWLWSSALSGGRARRDLERSFAGVLGLLLTSMHMTLLGALLALPPRVLYDHGSHGLAHEHAHGVLGELTPLDDQHLGGAIMIVLGGASYLAGAIWLSAGLLRRRGAIGSRLPMAKAASARERRKA
jgi:putative membrane protein